MGSSTPCQVSRISGGGEWRSSLILVCCTTDISPGTEGTGDGLSLAQYIREVALLTGTKVSCGEGGCGACIVTVVKGPNQPGRSVNSCLTPVNICHGWSITTIEGLGSKATHC